jgi:4-hydroxy-tetrahydrodipicolinate synthase
MLRGSIVALVTPWTADGSAIDKAALKGLIDWHIEQGTKAILPCGTTGESPSFSHGEQHQMIELTVEYVNKRIPVLAGAGSNATAEAVSLAKNAERLGADAILTITPYYNKPPQEGLFRHFKAVREACDLPMMLYNVPGRTGVNLLPETAARVAELGKLEGVKEASGNLDQIHQLIQLGVKVVSGDDGLTWPILALGGQGVISVVANFAPRLMADLCQAAAAGDMARARELHAQVHEFAKWAFCETNPIPAKTTVAAMGKCAEAFRLPLVPLGRAKKDAMLQFFRKQGLL